MNAIKSFWRRIKTYFVHHPALISGLIIYCYLFFSIIQLFFKVRHTEVTWADTYAIFSALPFMWLLAVSLVKVIEDQTVIHLQDQVLQIKNTKLRTLHEVAKGIQHQVNNPLAIISLSLGQLKRAVGTDNEKIKKIESIEESLIKISNALQNFSEAERYESEHVDDIVGTMTSLSKENQET